MVELLAEFDQIDPKVLNERGENIIYTFLRHSSLNDNDTFDVLKILLNSGVALEEIGSSAFIFAVEFLRYPKLIEFFITLGCDVNQKYDYCRLEYPLLMATWQRHENTVKFLLKNKAEINAKRADGATALHLACFCCRSRMISLLVQEGADISAENNKGQTPFMSINREDSFYKFAMRTMVNEFAKMAFEGIPVSKTDMKSILQNPVAKKCFEESMNELKKMSSVTFHAPYTYYSVLKMSKNLNRLAKLLKNQEFEKSFLKHFSFELYEQNLMNIFEEALKIRENAKKIESRLKSIFGSYFPDVVMRKLENHLTVKDLPLV